MGFAHYYLLFIISAAPEMISMIIISFWITFSLKKRSLNIPSPNPA